MGDRPPQHCPLAGRWSIERRVRDMRLGHDAVFAGTADIAPDPDAPGELCWREEGELVSAAHRGPARRVMRIVASGGAWEVLFDDRRPFHPLDLSQGACDVVHLCGADRYEGAFRIEDHGRVSVRWRVRGPTKDLEITSEYRREGLPG
jgi:hypothetical protein